ncbi:MAG: hypothetical protein II179_03060 [Alphaproteobacteria bacterium]|nr:hypothetical protein [Alphaproteobacteria bacterium]
MLGGRSGFSLSVNMDKIKTGEKLLWIFQWMCAFHPNQMDKLFNLYASAIRRKERCPFKVSRARAVERLFVLAVSKDMELGSYNTLEKLSAMLPVLRSYAEQQMQQLGK